MDLASVSTEFLSKLILDAKGELARRRINSGTRASVSLNSMIHYATVDILHADVSRINSENLLSLPLNPRSSINENKKYIQCVLNQDWSHLFDSYSNVGTEFYVYAHVDPRNAGFACSEINILPGVGIPFYIGKGTGARAYDLKRNQGHGKMIETLRRTGYSDSSIVKIISDGISERAAMELEAKIIYFFGTIYEQTRRGILLNLDLSKRPEFIGAMHMYVSRKVINKLNISDSEKQVLIGKFGEEIFKNTYRKDRAVA